MGRRIHQINKDIAAVYDMACQITRSAVDSIEEIVGAEPHGPGFAGGAELAAVPGAAAHQALSILLVDDDELMQNALRETLEYLGHRVTTAWNGEQALVALETSHDPDLVILDMNMPGLGGIATLPRLRALRPVVPVLLSTGLVDQAALELVSAHAGVTLLSKPFDLNELQQHLHSVRPC
jgi:two-component system OmpR family response regulator